MTITIYETSPYHDDFDQTKNFFRILFKGGRPVQPRELNQLQTIINNQFDKLTSHFFKDGSPVVGGNVAFNKEYSFVKLESTFTHSSVAYTADNYASEYVGTIITGLTSGVKARVLQVVQPVNSDPLTIYVRYEDSGTSNENKTFLAQEVFSSNGEVVRYGKVKPLASTPMGYGANFSVDEGNWYVNGVLVYAPYQNIILGKYSPNGINARLSYKISEQVITSATDTSLLDNTLGSEQLSGTGADRQKVTLTLIQEDLDVGIRDPLNNKLIQLIVIEDSRVKKSAKTEYSDLGDTLAQRTYEESGNYTVNNFGINIKEHLNNGTNLGQYTSEGGGNANKLAIGIEKGVAYVYGYRVEIEDTIYIDVDKARDVAYKNSASLTVKYGNYIEVDTLVSIPDIQNFTTANLRNVSNTTIGTARIRHIQYVSGSGTSAKYRLYIFDVIMNSGQSFANITNIQQTVPYGGAAFTANVISASSLFNSDTNKMLFDLPFSTVKTLRDTLSNIESIYDAKILINGTVTSNSLTISTSNSEIIFNSSSLSEYIVTNGTTGAIVVPTSVTVNSPANTATLGFTGHNGHVVYIYAPVTKVNTAAREKTKTLTTGATVDVTTPTTTDSGVFFSLDKCDVLKVNSIVNGGKDITNRFILDDGQRDNFYTTGRIQLKQGFPTPTGTTTINFDYFTHGAGDYFSVDSYANIAYDQIPSYKGKSLRDVLDFRPVKDYAGVNFTSTGASRGDVVVPNSVFISDMQFYLPRIDKVFVDKNGKFGVSKGISSSPPQVPNNPKDSMVIYTLSVNPYTFGAFDIIPNLVDNSRSTMEDIRSIKKRVDKLEYYVALSLLEKQTANLQIFDDSGLEKYKNGFIANSFYGHNLSYTNHPDYKCSIDKVKGQVRPLFYQDNVKLTYNSGLSTGVQKTGSLLTLPYTKVVEEKQPFATESINVNPYNVFSWSGMMELSPSSDEWKETKRRPDVIFNNEGIYDSLLNIIDETDANGTIWNEWSSNWIGVETNNQTTFDSATAHGLSWGDTIGQTVAFNRGIGIGANGSHLRQTDTVVTTTTESQSRTGIGRRVVSETLTNNLGDRVVEVNFVPFMRSRKVYFKAERLKPNTRLHAFFDGQNVNAFVKPETFVNYSDVNSDNVTNYLNATSHPNSAGNLVTDASGTVQGSFLVPNNNAMRFKTGARPFKLTDSSTNSFDDETTTAEVIYEAKGIIEQKENLVISTQVPRIERSVVRENRVISDTRIQETTQWIDPLAQSFLLDRVGGVFLESIDLFFKTKDPTIPVTVQIRVMENGIPTNRIVPFSEVTLKPADINISNNAATLTNFKFKSLVYLQQSVEYCFVILSNSDKYLCYVATLGDFDLTNTSVRVDKQPYAGVMFKSQNASTWTPEQTQDIKFTLHRAEFTQTSGTAVFNNVKMPLARLDVDAFEFTSGSNVIRVYHKNHGMFTGSRVRISGVEATSGSVINNIPLTQVNKVAVSNNEIPQASNTHEIGNVEFDTYTITVATNANATGRAGGANIYASENNLANVITPIIQEIVLPQTNIDYTIKIATGKSLAGTENPYSLSPDIEVIPNENIQLIQPYCIASQENETLSALATTKSFKMTSTFATDLTNISPVIDLDRLSLITISNRIDRPSGSIITGFNKVANFIPHTKGVGGSSLACHVDKKFTVKEDADSLKVFFNVNRPSGSYIDFYYKISSGNDADFDEKDWVLATPDDTIPFSDSTDTFNEVAYTINNLPNFTIYSGKIVLTTTNSSKVPIISDYRIIATT